MAFNVYTSSDINLLAKKLAQNIHEAKNIFIPDYVVTSNTGLNNWVKIQLADQNNIAANLRFVKNDDIINIAHRVLDEKEHDTRSLTSSHLLWLIYAELGKKEFTTKFTEVAEYCGSDVLKQHGLALKLSRLFQEYQVYIPEELEKDTDQDFQKYIWQQIKLQIKSKFITKKEIVDSITTQLQSTEKQSLLKEKMPNMHIFLGVDLTQHHVTIFKKLANYCNVHYYLFYPFKNMGNNNKLVSNWAKLLMHLPVSIEDATNLDEETSPSSTGSLLSKIQSDVYINSSERNEFTVVDIDDGSITINNCYTPTREVEVLYNYLLKTIDESNGDLGARDILVQVSDIDKYSSAINAIFSSAPVKLPYSLSDKSYSTTDSVYNAIEALINIDDNYKAEDIIQLLEYSAIRDKFEIEDIGLIRTLVNEANIRFGKNGVKDLETNTVSWLHGLNRLIYGFCIGGENAFNFEGDNGFLVDIVEGSQAFELINLHFFISKFINWVEDRSKSKTVSKWHIAIDNLVNDFVESENNDEINGLKRSVSELSDIDEHLKSEIDFRVVREFVTDLLSEHQQKSNFASYGITFCSMTQMRNIPYKVVAVLGANFNTFPRKDRPLSYDLLRDNTKINRPSIKDQDKYLFLQIIMSAKEKLYLSYVGKDTKTNTLIPPASVLDDLCDYIDEGLEDDASSKINLINEHPLHGFSSKYNSSAHPLLYSYLLNDPCIENKALEKETDAVTKTNEIELLDFINFFKNPIKHFYNKQLGIYYYEGQEILGDSELFEMDTLQQWSVKNKYLYDETISLEESRNELVEKGNLPLKNIGRNAINNISDDISILKARFVTGKEGKKENPIQIYLSIGDKTLVGKLANVYENQFVFPCVSKKNTNFKYIVEYQIKKIVLAAAGYNFNGVFMSIDGDNDDMVNNNALSKKQAQQKLNKLYDYYLQGQIQMLPFITEYDKAFYPIVFNHPIEEVERVLSKKVTTVFSNFTSEYLRKEFGKGFFSENKLNELKKNTSEILVNILEINF